MIWCSVAVLKCSSALWAAENFVPVGGGDAVTAVGYKSELANNVTVRYSFFSYNRSLDVSVGPFSPLAQGIDRVHHPPSCFLTSSNVVAVQATTSRCR
jgi:hypothetical protein